ncbi:hypothetical protein Q6D67_13255 [Haliea sp. E1-2-M8]|uniref:hypothetical protein n=1 Tax=Haliea sp. E1-2-M8 TaxID=3064706 RepID=UPI002726A08E|nr:hypothetical protein [Haliea sp. E1-2-M8]MDO8862672.1 hypothetical protein [Haliea sp. E1-2-M8]
MDILGKRGYLPLQVKWTAIVAAVVALAMAASSVLVFRAQSEVLTRQAVDSGMSLARFIAVQAAIPVLGEDWATLQALVDDAAARGAFRYLIIADHEGTVRSASDDSLIGRPWIPAGIPRELLSYSDGSRAQELEQAFNFRLPVLFNQTVVGRVDLGVDRAPLEAALDTTRRMLVALALAIVLAVSLVVFVCTERVARNLKRATSALKQPEAAAFSEDSLHDTPRADKGVDVMAALRGTLSEEWLQTGSGLLQSDLEAAISALEKSLRYNPGNRNASLRLQQARTAQRKLQRSQGS